MPAPVGAAASPYIAKGIKIAINLAVIAATVYMTKRELDDKLMDATPLFEGEDKLPLQIQRDISLIYPEAKCLFTMVKDMYSGEYKPEDPLAITTAVLSIGYLFLPVEDSEKREINDVKAISYAAGLCAKELKRYREVKGIPLNSEVSQIRSENPYK